MLIIQDDVHASMLVDYGVMLQIDSLLGEYEQHTGQKFGGSDAEYSILQKLVSLSCLEEWS